MKEYQPTFTDTELGFPLAWNKSPGKGFHKAVAWHHDLLNGEMAAWVKVRQDRYKDNQLAFIDAITEAVMPIIRFLPPQVRRIFCAVCKVYYAGIRPVDLKISTVEINGVTAILSRLGRVGLVKKIETGYVVSTLNVLRVYAVRCDSRFTSYLRKINYQSGATTLDDFIAQFAPMEVTYDRGSSNSG